MSGSGFNDRAKLAAAAELARSFKGNKGGQGSQGGRGPSKGSYGRLNQAFQPAPGASKTTHGRAVPMSTRRALSSSMFSRSPASTKPFLSNTGSASASASLDFLTRRDKQEPARSEPAQTASQQPCTPLQKASEALLSCKTPVPPATAQPSISGGDGVHEIQAKAGSERAEACVVIKEKPNGVVPGSMLDEFFTLIDGKVEPLELLTKDEVEESLIDLDAESSQVTGHENLGSSALTDLLSLESSSEAAKLTDALSAALPMAPGMAATGRPVMQGEIEDKAAPKGGELSPEADSFIPEAAGSDRALPPAAGGSTVLTQDGAPPGAWAADTPGPGPFDNPFSYMLLVPLSHAQVIAVANYQARPQVAAAASNGEVEKEESVRPTGERKPKGGLRTSKWAV